ncbi:condensation domain-containing protein, partial [Methylosarcina fibrata]|uniref:condensation domain-containing protein n=1 Tax=Methylosarcina fibrata TaxID=105972 RepID=UPI00052593B5
MTFNPAHSQNFVDLLVRRAERHPERIALHCIADGDGAVLSYGFADLDRRARAVAAHLQTVCAPGDRALILLHSGIDYVAAFFGCLYAGVIAVPAYPPESQAPQHLKRVASILHDAQPKLVLSHTALLDSVNAALATRCVSQRPAAIAVDQIDNAEAAAWRMPVIARDALAFLQYTSGSTASPKGVMVGHDNLLANQRAIKHGFGIHEDDVFVSWLPLYHDMGLVGSLMQPLYSGIPLALMSPRHFLERPLRWLEAVSRFGGTISGGPDFAYRLCNERIGEAQLVGLRLDSWRLAFCGAEPIRHETLASFAEKFSIAGLPASAPYPCYGLAEASLLVSGGLPGEGAHAVVYAADALAEHRAELAESGSVIVDCGRVQPEHQLAIVDLASGLECDECRIGEIRFSGPSVTHGYWQNPAATLEAFVHEDGKTWLRTGDLGFVRDGRLFVAGRVKDMILIRGQNLYPQDIEQALEEQIKLLRKGRIAAFSVNVDGREGIGIAAEIGRGTQKRVPAENLFDAINDTLAQCCQQPATLILLLNPGALPKTSSGKLQRRACYQAWREGALDVYASQWDGQRQPEQAAAEELTDFERSVAMIWREVLNVATVSAQQSFFALGGQSIAVIQAVAALSEQLGVTVEPALFFEKPKLREFAAVVEAQVNESATATVAPIAKGEQSEGLLLTYGQESLWFLMQLDPSSTAYHIAGGARIVGELDCEVLTQAFGVLALRHDALRTVFYAVDGQPRQRILPAFDVDLAYHDVRELPCGEAQAQAAQLAEQSARIPFDLERGPLWRMLLVRLPAQEGQACHELNLTLHHLIADGWSLNRLLAEFAECYGAIQAGREPRLPLLPIRHADFASWQRHWLEAGEAERQLAYWTGWLGGEQPVIELPYDRARPAEPSQRGGRVNFVLPEAVSQALPAVARQHGVTPFMLLLAAFNVLLYRYSGQNDLRIGLPVANRNRPETQHLIGYFVNTVVLRSQINAQSGFDTLLQHTKQTLLQAQAHPDLPFEHLVDALQPERRLGQNPLFQILINHQQTDIGLLAQHEDWQIEALDRDNGAAQFDLSLDTWQDSRGRIGGFFTYARDLFDGATIERLAGHYQNLLAQLLAQPQAAIAAHGLLGAEEARQLQAWNTWP